MLDHQEAVLTDNELEVEPKRVVFESLLVLVVRWPADDRTHEGLLALVEPQSLAGVCSDLLAHLLNCLVPSESDYNDLFDRVEIELVQLVHILR